MQYESNKLSYVWRNSRGSRTCHYLAPNNERFIVLANFSSYSKTRKLIFPLSCSSSRILGRWITNDKKQNTRFKFIRFPNKISYFFDIIKLATPAITPRAATATAPPVATCFICWASFCSWDSIQARCNSEPILESGLDLSIFSQRPYLAKFFKGEKIIKSGG